MIALAFATPVSLAAVTATGDFDGDGRPDVAFGSPDTDGGLVVVRYTRDADVGADSEIFAPRVGRGGSRKAARFGDALAAGDFDGDGLDDLAIGVSRGSGGGEAGSGCVIVVYGSATGLDLRETVDQGMFFEERAEAGDAFGASLAAGDFDGDGYDDLAIGAPGERRAGHQDGGWIGIKRGSVLGLAAGRRAWTVDLGADEPGPARRERLDTWDVDGRTALVVESPDPGGWVAVRVERERTVLAGVPRGAESAIALWFAPDGFATISRAPPVRLAP